MSESPQLKNPSSKPVDAEGSPEVGHWEPSSQEEQPSVTATAEALPSETGGPSGPEPTRYGDWERKGRCIDF